MLALHETHLNPNVISVHAVRKKQKSLVHEGKKPFSCTICDVRFTQSGSLNGHISAVSEVDMIVDMGRVGICEKTVLRGKIKFILGKTFSFL